MNPNVDDYPEGYLSRYLENAKILSRRFKNRLLITIPDYPDDYNPGQFGDNVSKTFENIYRFAGIKGINWLPTIQAKYLNAKSFTEACRNLKEIDDFRHVAIGTVCKTKKLFFIKRCCGIARSFFPDAWIHAFGLTLNAIVHVTHLIDSFDSMAWTFPRHPGRWSAKNQRERVEYFRAYIKLTKKYAKACKTQSLWKFISNQKERQNGDYKNYTTLDDFH